jgi:hypothetical protein
MVRYAYALFIVLMAFPAASFGQAGSAGGSIGNDEKSLSGTRAVPTERSTRTPPPETNTDFDGTWVFTALNSCGPSSTTVGKFVEGKLVGGTGNGTINPNGEYHYARAGKAPVISSGKLAGKHGSGVWRSVNNKCQGTWTAERQ